MTDQLQAIDQPPPAGPDVLAGMLALTLDEAMQRLHNTHSPNLGRNLGREWTRWTTCETSTLCRGAAGLYEMPETRLAIAVAKEARGE